MSLSEKKLNLIERLIQLKDPVKLRLIDEILIRAEMESRFQESLKDVENGDVMTLEEFSKRNQKWLKKKFKKS